MHAPPFSVALAAVLTLSSSLLGQQPGAASPTPAHPAAAVIPALPNSSMPAAAVQRATPPPAMSQQASLQAAAARAASVAQPAPVAVPLPPSVPTVRPAQPVQPGQNDNGDNEETVPFIQFPNADVQGVLDMYEKLTGKKIIRDGTVQGQVNIVVNRAVPKSEAITILETALLVNGFTMMAGPNDIVIVVGQGKNPRAYGVPIYIDLDQLPAGDSVVTFIFKLEYADPTEVFAVLTQYLPPSSSGAPALVLGSPGKAQAIAVTETVPVIRSAAEIIKQLDRPPAEVVSEFITLQRADAKDVLEKLEKIFEKKENQTGVVAPPGQPPPPNSPAANAAAAATAMPLSEDSLIVGKIKLTADVRTNRIHVVTRPINMPFVRRLIEEFDTELAFGEPTVRPLKFVSAGDVMDVIVKAIAQPGQKEGEGGETAKSAAPVSNPSTYSGNTGLGSNNGTGTGGSSLGAEELTTKEVETAPEARTVGNTKIIADRRNNTIIIMGNEEVKNKIFKVLDEIDVRTPQVMLTCIIGELSLNDSKQFGAQYLLHRKGQTSGTTTSFVTGTSSTVVTNTNGVVTGTTFTPVVLGTNTVVTGSGASGIFAGIGGAIPGTATIPVDLSTLTSAAAVLSAFGTGGGITGLVSAGSHLNILLSALESTGRFHIISRPMVYTSNNKKAIISSGQNVPVPTQTQSTGYPVSGTNSGVNYGNVSTSNVSYQDVSLKLEVQPLINADNEVTLDIVQEVNSIAASSGVTTSSGITAPTINSRRLKTTVSVANKATVVLGGLVQETKQVNKSGIPILDKIPLLGALFSSQTMSTDRSELIVMITPTVTNTPVDAVRAGERAQEGLNFPPDLEHTLDPAGTRAKVNGRSGDLMIPPKSVVRPESE